VNTSVEPQPLLIGGDEVPKRPKRITDSKLKRVSISTNSILFDKDFQLKREMADLLPSLSTKYRIFLITQIPAEKSNEYQKAQLSIEELVKQNAVQEHRVMYCCTAKGKESLVRQLGADLHLESDV
jgi:hypothetical protein